MESKVYVSNLDSTSTEKKSKMHYLNQDFFLSAILKLLCEVRTKSINKHMIIHIRDLKNEVYYYCSESSLIINYITVSMHVSIRNTLMVRVRTMNRMKWSPAS